MSKYEITVENPSYELEIEDDTVTILQIAEQGPAGPSGASLQLSNATPQPLGTAAPGVSTQAMRGDAVIQMPSAAQVGAASTGALATETARAIAAEALLTPLTRTVTGTAPIQINGDNAAHDLSANLTASIAPASATVPGSMSAADFFKLLYFETTDQTIYVAPDGGGGSDSNTGDIGSQLATIGEAASRLNGFKGQPVIQLSAGTYTVAANAPIVIPRGAGGNTKWPIIRGAPTRTQSGLGTLTATSGVRGSGSTFGSIVASVSLTLNAWERWIVRCVTGTAANIGIPRFIGTNTTTGTFEICGSFPAQPQAGDTFVVEKPPTIITASTDLSFIGGDHSFLDVDFNLGPFNAIIFRSNVVALYNCWCTQVGGAAGTMQVESVGALYVGQVRRSTNTAIIGTSPAGCSFTNSAGISAQYGPCAFFIKNSHFNQSSIQPTPGQFFSIDNTYFRNGSAPSNDGDGFLIISNCRIDDPAPGGSRGAINLHDNATLNLTNVYMARGSTWATAQPAIRVASGAVANITGLTGNWSGHNAIELVGDASCVITDANTTTTIAGAIKAGTKTFANMAAVAADARYLVDQTLDARQNEATSTVAGLESAAHFTAIETTIPASVTAAIATAEAYADALTKQNISAPVIDYNSLVQGDVSAIEWRSIDALNAPKLRRNNATTETNYLDAVLVNVTGSLGNTGCLWHSFVAPVGCTSVLLSVPMKQQGSFSGQSPTIGIYTDDGVTAIATSTPTVTSSEVVYTVTASVTAGTWYRVLIAVNSHGSNNNSLIVVGRVKLAPTGATGVFASSFARIHIRPEMIHNNGRAREIYNTGSGYGYTIFQPHGTRASALASIKFDTDSAAFALEIYDDYADGYDRLPLSIDGRWTQTLAPPAANQVHLLPVASLSSTMKRIEIVSGPQVRSNGGSFVPGTHFRALYVPVTKACRVTMPEPKLHRLTLYGDSISAGYNSTVPGAQSIVPLMRAWFPGDVTCDAFGSRDLYNEAFNATYRRALVNQLVENNPTILILAIGRNDWANGNWTPAAFGTAYQSLLQDLAYRLPACRIYAQSPLAVSNEATAIAGHTIVEFRTAISDAVTAANAAISANAEQITYVTGLTIIANGATYFHADGIHPNDAGHGQWAAYWQVALRYAGS